MPAGEADSLPNESDLEEVSCNARHGEQASELFPEIDARYDHTEGALEKEFDDWQLSVDTSHYPRSPDRLFGDIDPVPDKDKPDSDENFEADSTPRE